MSDPQQFAETQQANVAAAQWYALYVIARHEKTIAEQLRRRSLESLLPTYRSVRYWNKRRAEVELPLFPSYIFVNIALREKLRVLEVPGVVHIVSFNGIPAPLPQSEVDTLKAALVHRRSEPHPYLRVGRRVRIKAGPLLGLEGIVVQDKNVTKMVVSIDFIQRSTAVQLEAIDLEAIA